MVGKARDPVDSHAGVPRNEFRIVEPRPSPVKRVARAVHARRILESDSGVHPNRPINSLIMAANTPQISIILATHNRASVLGETLATLRGLTDPVDHEILVVDNASDDDSAVVARRLADRVMARTDNLGSCAKGIALQDAAGEFILFLDDDSTPRAGSLVRLLAYFRADPGLGAVGFRVDLPDGRQEGGALPGVPIGCGVAFRRQALMSTGGIALDFFMQAEEYDWSFRLVSGGWKIRICSDLVVDHHKTKQARLPARTLYYDTRNNLRIVNRYLPEAARQIYLDDWTQRYGWFASYNQSECSPSAADSDTGSYAAAFQRGVDDAGSLAQRERDEFSACRLAPTQFEYFFRWNALAAWAEGMSREGVREVRMLGLGKNVYAFGRALLRAGIRVREIIDDRLGAPGRRYRDIPLALPNSLSGLRSFHDDVDAVVIGDMATVHAAATLRRHASRLDGPVHIWAESGDDYAMTCRVMETPVPV